MSLSGEEWTTEPDVPGWYGYSGGAQTLMFLLDLQGQWWVFASNGDTAKCEWGYIEQALGVWDLVQHARLRKPDQRMSQQDLADRLRVLAMADEESAKDGTRTAKAAAKAAADAYRLAASMIEELG